MRATQDDSERIQDWIDGAAQAGDPITVIPYGTYSISRPLIVPSNMNLQGPATIIPFGGYAGPMLTIGLPNPGFSDPASGFRPIIPPGTLYDASVQTQRYGIETFGQRILGITSHPLQLGHKPNNGFHDYWARGGVFTFDLLIGKPLGVTWTDGAPLLGFGDGSGGPNPWLLRYAVLDGVKGFYFDWKASDGTHRAFITSDDVESTWRISFQLDMDTPRINGWFEGTQRPSMILRDWPVKNAGYSPSKMLPHDGFAPFLLGGTGAQCGLGLSDFTPVQLYGMRIVRGEVYQWNKPTQTLILGPDIPVRDEERYFSTHPLVIPGDSLIALLPLDDAPGNPWVNVVSGGGQGCLWWCPPLSDKDAVANVRIEDLTIQARQQPGVCVGYALNLKLKNVISGGGAQGYGVMPFHVGYPVTFEGCDFSGYDSAMTLWGQMGTMRDSVLSNCGRYGIRQFGGYGIWENIFVGRVTPGLTEAVFSAEASPDGGFYNLRLWNVDNEDRRDGRGPGVSRAMVEVKRSVTQRTRLTIDGFQAAELQDEASMVRLSGEGNKPASIEASGLTVYKDIPGNALFAEDPGWAGWCDMSMMPVGSTILGAVDKITSVPPETLPINPVNPFGKKP